MKNKIIIVFIVLFFLVWWFYLGEKYRLPRDAKYAVIKFYKSLTKEFSQSESEEKVHVPFAPKEEPPKSKAPFQARFDHDL